MSHMTSVGLSICLAFLVACGTGPEINHPPPGETVDGGHRDAGSDAESADEVDFASDAAEVVDLETDAEDEPSDPLEFVPPNTILCDGSNEIIEYESFGQEFSVPERPTSPFPGDVRRFDDAIYLVSTFRAPDELAPGDKFVRSLFVESGDDVTFYHGFFISEAVRWEWEGGRGSYSVFVDGKPVEATFKLWDIGRYEELETITAMGYAPEFPGHRIWIDITIAAEHFEPGRMNMVHVAMRATQANGAHIMSDYGKVSVYYGGYDLPSHACVPPAEPLVPLIDQYNPEWSREVGQGYELGWVFPEGFSDWVKYREARWQKVSPGETMRVTYEIAATRVKTFAFAPILDGVPLRPLEVAASEFLPKEPFSDSFPQTTVARGTVEFQAPIEPGIHHFWVATWFDPYFPGEGPNAERTYFGPEYAHGRAGELVMASTTFGGTHTMTIEVVEPE